MILVTPGIVLSRKPSGEYDRLAFLYTRACGKVAARFIGVDRPRGKLKALSEPMVLAEYRLYARPATGRVTVTGGRIIDSFPRLRSHWESMLSGLEMCEHLTQMTPEASPSIDKFDLIVQYLQALEHAPSPWLPVSFGLRLLKLAGLGLGHADVTREDRKIWEKLHRDDAPSLEIAGIDPTRLGRFRNILEQVVETHSERPLRTKAFRTSMIELGQEMVLPYGRWESSHEPLMEKQP